MGNTLRRARKGQTSLELLIVTAMGLVIVGIMFTFAITWASDSARNAQASDAVEKIARSADLVYALGSGSRINVDVMMPDGIRSTNVTGRRVLIQISTTTGNADIFATPRENLTGSLTNQSGRQTVTLVVNSSGSVIVNSTG